MSLSGPGPGGACPGRVRPLAAFPPRAVRRCHLGGARGRLRPCPAQHAVPGSPDHSRLPQRRAWHSGAGPVRRIRGSIPWRSRPAPPGPPPRAPRGPAGRSPPPCRLPCPLPGASRPRTQRSGRSTSSPPSSGPGSSAPSPAGRGPMTGGPGTPAHGPHRTPPLSSSAAAWPILRPSARATRLSRPAPRLPPPSPPVGSHTLGLRVASRRSNFSAGSTLRGRLRGGLRRDGGQPGPVRPDQAGGRGRPAAHGRHRGARRSRAVRGVGAGRLRAGVCPHGRALHLRPTPVLAVRWCPLGCAAPSCR